MIKHIILWKLNDSVENPDKVKSNVKSSLEALAGAIDGILKIEVHINGLESSSCDMMLDSAFESIEAYKNYKIHPAHVSAADTYVRPYVSTRLCLDFEE